VARCPPFWWGLRLHVGPINAAIAIERAREERRPRLLFGKPRDLVRCATADAFGLPVRNPTAPLH
jgi:hypothetical protein